MTPVVQDEQTRVDNTLTFQGDCRDVIDRLFHTSIGIQVGTELHANGLTPGNNAQAFALAREILRTVKRHVLQEMSQSALTGFLLNRAHPLGNVEISQSRFLGIMTDIVRHSVLQCSLPEGSILRQRLGVNTETCRHQQQ